MYVYVFLMWKNMVWCIYVNFKNDNVVVVKMYIYVCII